MKNSINILTQISINKIYVILFCIFFSYKIQSAENDYEFKISGNQNTDKEVILSIIENIPENLIDQYSNYILNELNNSGLFSEIKVRNENNIFYIDVIEYPVIKKISYLGNERFKDEELDLIAKELNINIFNDLNINNFTSEIKNAYSSFGYNNVKILVTKAINNQNIASVFVDIFEGEITKIKSIKFRGNIAFANSDLEKIIKSKVKNLTNIFANNNFKPIQVNTDKQRLINFYKDKGYADVNINYNVEYYQNNSVVIYFNINEGVNYIVDDVNFKNFTKEDKIENLLKDLPSKNKNKIYNTSILDKIEKDISRQLKIAGIQFFEIKRLVKFDNGKAKLLFEIYNSTPVYINNINIEGNYRTLDYVIRRELDVNEGDAFLSNEIVNIKRNVQSLGFFEEVTVNKKSINDNLVDIQINIKENQTGTFTAGASFGTLDGVTLVTGLNETNIGGTGRAVELLINNSENNSEYTFNTRDRFFGDKNIYLDLGLSYKQSDYSKSSSYTLDKYKFSSGLSYKLQEKLFHSIKLSYELDDIYVTDSSTASSTITDVEGGSVKFVLVNALTYNNLNSLFFPRNGDYLKFESSIETPSSSKNGYIKNTITYRIYKEFNKDIASFQAKIGNVFSLNNSDILPNAKYSLGGKWLRGFDNYGVGPRNSRTSYIGGNNIFVTKIDYSKLLLKNDDNPIYFNIFNDFGLVWDNKTSPTFKDESFRSSAGFGIKFYSFIGPIAFTWGFPIEDESYDIKRMFTFSVGNIN